MVSATPLFLLVFAFWPQLWQIHQVSELKMLLLLSILRIGRAQSLTFGEYGQRVPNSDFRVSEVDFCVRKGKSKYACPTVKMSRLLQTSGQNCPFPRVEGSLRILFPARNGKVQ